MKVPPQKGAQEANHKGLSTFPGGRRKNRAHRV